MNLLKGTEQQDRFISGDYVVKNRHEAISCDVHKQP